jgi:cardiolipin synthase
MWDNWQIGFVLFAVVEVSLATAVTIHAVMWKRDSRAVIGWVGLAWLAPIVGALAYFSLGVNRLHRKAVALDIPDSWNAERDDDWTEEDQQRRKGFETAYPHLVGLEQAGRWLTQHYPQPGNSVEPLIDGDQAYPAMLQAINGAEHSVALLSYIFDSG